MQSVIVLQECLRAHAHYYSQRYDEGSQAFRIHCEPFRRKRTSTGRFYRLAGRSAPTPPSPAHSLPITVASEADAGYLGCAQFLRSASAGANRTTSLCRPTVIPPPRLVDRLIPQPEKR